jgi:hypothetical protein
MDDTKCSVASGGEFNHVVDFRPGQTKWHRFIKPSKMIRIGFNFNFGGRQPNNGNFCKMPNSFASLNSAKAKKC